jgi:hypothetical protein
MELEWWPTWAFGTKRIGSITCSGASFCPEADVPSTFKSVCPAAAQTSGVCASYRKEFRKWVAQFFFDFSECRFPLSSFSPFFGIRPPIMATAIKNESGRVAERSVIVAGALAAIRASIIISTVARILELENRCTGNGTVGSNPTLFANVH